MWRLWIAGLLLAVFILRPLIYGVVGLPSAGLHELFSAVLAIGSVSFGLWGVMFMILQDIKEQRKRKRDSDIT